MSVTTLAQVLGSPVPRLVLLAHNKCMHDLWTQLSGSKVMCMHTRRESLGNEAKCLVCQYCLVYTTTLSQESIISPCIALLPSVREYRLACLAGELHEHICSHLARHTCTTITPFSFPSLSPFSPLPPFHNCMCQTFNTNPVYTVSVLMAPIYSEIF